MTIGLDLCAAILQSGDLQAVKRSGLTPRRLTDDEQVVFNAITGHLLQYGALPTRETLALTLGQEVVDTLPDEVPEPLQFYIDRVNRRALGVMVAEHVKKAAKSLNDGSPDGALKSMEDAVGIARRGGMLGRAPVDLTATGEARLAQYVDRHEHGIEAVGLQTPWATMNRVLMGLEPGTFTALAGRVWSGKTWLLLKMLEEVWVGQQKSPLLVSMEMPEFMLGRRLDAVRAEVNYRELLKGMLDTEDEERYRETIKDLKHLPPLHCASPPLVRSVEDLRAVILEYRPDGGVWVDGLNRLRAGEDADRYRRVAEAADEIKFMAEDTGQPLVGTTHLNKAGGKSSKAGTQADLEDFGYAYAIPEQINNGFLLFATDDMQENNTRLIKTLKVREEADHVPGFFINFDPARNFDEIGPWDGEDLLEDGGFDEAPVPF